MHLNLILTKYLQSFRKHNVSSLALDPLWIPFSTVKVAEEFLYFTMTLMTGKFRSVQLYCQIQNAQKQTWIIRKIINEII